MEPEQLNDFLDHVKDINGYLTACIVNHTGDALESRLAPYMEFLGSVGKKDVDPVDFYECITELYSILGILITAFPKEGQFGVEDELLPAMKVIDQLRGMFRANQNA